ncbi:hypothetical protein AAF463_23695 (plasmid) [Pantoea sp. BJ2]|uniref:Uncharacterized protein n=1 Tax=Pantoea sp. BJ2 TaxID=3141322 RepID=A0AAU7U3S9_9GAMM
MNTHNLNTATPESPKTWLKTPRARWLERKDSLLTELAKIEGDLLMHRSLEQIDGDYWTEERFFSPCDAANIVKNLIEAGAINSPVVYDMVLSVEALALELGDHEWRRIHPAALAELSIYKSDAEAARKRCIAVEIEKEKPYGVFAYGEMRYPFDEHEYETQQEVHTICLGRARTVAEAIEIAAKAWLEDKWDSHEPEKIYQDSDTESEDQTASFIPGKIFIKDDQERAVLMTTADKLEWKAPVA